MVGVACGSAGREWAGDNTMNGWMVVVNVMNGIIEWGRAAEPRTTPQFAKSGRRGVVFAHSLSL